jgi:hypothetical protein
VNAAKELIDLCLIARYRRMAIDRQEFIVAGITDKELHTRIGFDLPVLVAVGRTHKPEVPLVTNFLHTHRPRRHRHGAQVCAEETGLLMLHDLLKFINGRLAGKVFNFRCIVCHGGCVFAYGACKIIPMDIP